MTHRLSIAVTALLLTTAPALHAQTATPPVPPAASPETAQGDVSISIYNNDLAMVQDVRTLPIGTGRVRIELPDVSARIRPQTVSFVASGTRIVEQNFDYSLLSPDSLMNAAVGQAITIVRTNPATGLETRQRATVLAVNGGVVLRVGDTIEVLRDDGLPVRVIFDRIPAGLRARPTLSITVDSSEAGSRSAGLRYLTQGLSWAADYVALFDERAGRIDVQGWVTLNNTSGTTYTNAATTLVAGAPGAMANGRGRGGAITLARLGTESSDRERLGDFYLYPIPGRTTIATSQTKQVSFLNVQGVPAQRVFTRTISGFSSDEEAEPVTSSLAFSASASGGLGAALPAGTVRFYERDRRGAPQFVGESAIDHTPMGSELRLATGQAFDVRVQATRMNREQSSSSAWRTGSRVRVTVPGQPTATYTSEYLERRPYWRTTMRYTVTNARPEPVTVRVTQSQLDWWYDATQLVSEEIEGRSDTANRRTWSVTVPANADRSFTVVYDTRY